MDFKEKIGKGKFVITGELGPPKGTNVAPYIDEIEKIKEYLDVVNVTDLQSSVMRMGSLPVCRLLIDRGIEPLFQLTCRDRNRLALQSDLLGAAALGIKNVLALTGDHTVLGDHPQAKPVFDLDSVSLLQVISDLSSGKDMAGNSLDGKPDFFPGAVVSPSYSPMELQLLKMEKKIAAGAKFFQTQAVYDVELFEKFMKKASRFNVPVIAGIVLLKSSSMAKFMNDNVAGVTVPDRYIEMLAKAKKKERPGISVNISAEIIRGIKELCSGVHIMALGWDRYIPRVLEAAGL